MKVRGLTGDGKNRPSAITVGSFDGVHLGHQAILKQVLSHARDKGLSAVAVTFDPHPRQVLGKGNQPIALLTTLEEKLALFESMGFEEGVVIPFDRNFAALSSREFVEKLNTALDLQAFIIGYDHHFGRNREGSITELKSLGKDLGFAVEQVGPVEIGGMVSSSTRIREALRNGDIETATQFLGRPYQINGVVQRGDGRGRTLGFPTANIALGSQEKLLPAKGVYAVDVSLKQGDFRGMMNIGTRPTFEFERLTLEVHLFNFQASIYDEEISVRLLKYVRPEKKFAGVEALQEQLEKDKIYCENV